MTTIFLPAGASTTPAPRVMARNGLSPTAFHQLRLRGLANHIAAYRTKHVASFVDADINLGGTNWSDGDPARVRWRCLYHSSPFASRLKVITALFRPDLHDDGSIDTTPNHHQISVLTLAGALIGVGILPGSPATNQFSDLTIAPENFFYRYGTVLDISGAQFFDVPPDTDLHIAVDETPKLKTIAVAIYEEALSADTDNGYLDGSVHVGSPILASKRAGVASILSSTWLRGASPLFHWSKIMSTGGTYGPRTTSSATSTNLIDQVSTGAVTGSSAGFALNLENTRRLKDTGANVTVWVFGKNSVASNGQVKLLQSGGGTITVGPFSTSLGWVSGTGSLAASNAPKCDLQFSTASGTLTVEAVSVLLQD